jgi:mannose-6-phosphate isomerase
LERIEKSWGHEILFAVTEKYIGKILFIKKGHRLSLQYHNNITNKKMRCSIA